MPESPIEKLSYLVLGWLLGILSPVIVDAIKRKRENALGRQAIVSELRELGCMLAAAAYGVRMARGTADRDFLHWLKTDLERHAVSEQFQALIPSLGKQLAWSDETIALISTHLAERDGKGTVLQHYPVPLLDARVAALWSFDTSFQRGLLSIRQSLSILDDLVERSRKYHDMTFSKHEGDNYRFIVENFDQACDLYAERAVKTVNLIRNLTEAHK